MGPLPSLKAQIQIYYQNTEVPQAVRTLKDSVRVLEYKITKASQGLNPLHILLTEPHWRGSRRQLQNVVFFSEETNTSEYAKN